MRTDKNNLKFIDRRGNKFIFKLWSRSGLSSKVLTMDIDQAFRVSQVYFITNHNYLNMEIINYNTNIVL